jgi:hypothetical protein
MNEPMDLICDVEEAITNLEVMIDAHCPEPQLVSEIQRLDRRLRLIRASEPIFSRPA